MVAINGNHQLKKRISSAACILLGTIPAAQAGESEGWKIDSSVLYYQEGDSRVSAIEPVIDLRRFFLDGREANIKFTLDSLTGASPNGATATNKAQTFTRPSGNDSYIVQPGEIPLDNTFRDTRIAVNGSWKQPLNRLTSLTMGANFSKEYDFLSYGGNAMLSRDFNQKNTTVMLGVSTEFDTINPEGGIPTPLARMQPVGKTLPRDGNSDNKTVMDALLGVTQVINRRTLMQLNYSYSRASGYLNDPFKILSLVNPVTGETDNIDPATNGYDYLYEKRPESRTKHALFWLGRYNFDRDVLSGSYRYFMDDWGIKSHTIDMNYNWRFSAKQYLEPRLRFYSQSEADFFRVNLQSGEPLPVEASADYRLAKFNGFTYGLKWGWNINDKRAFIVRLEYYTQIGDSSPSSAIGVQRGLDLYPDLKATILQVQYRF